VALALDLEALVETERRLVDGEPRVFAHLLTDRGQHLRRDTRGRQVAGQVSVRVEHDVGRLDLLRLAGDGLGRLTRDRVYALLVGLLRSEERHKRVPRRTLELVFAQFRKRGDRRGLLGDVVAELARVYQ
jgi:hypothetical protein